MIFGFKLLVLIIASDNLPVYKNLEQVWRSYMHLDPEHVEAYFIRGNPDLTANYEIVDDVLWSKTIENPKPGMLNKTILSLEFFRGRLDEFDYVLRTNLSSFYYFPNLLKFLATLPKTKCYAADGKKFGSGCGYFLSPDVVKLMINNKHLFLNNSSDYDDVVVGDVFRKCHIPLLPVPRIDFASLQDWLLAKDKIPSEAFHFRIKNREEKLRVTEDLFILSELLKRYYFTSAF